MNTQVTATGMQVKAVAEDGIVISNVTKGSWTNEADANYSSVIGLKPTSTIDTSAWYHNVANDVNNYVGVQAYENLTTALSLSDTTNTEGVGYKESGTTAGFQAAEDSCYYLLSKYYIRSSGDALSGIKLYINTVTIDSSRSGTASALQAIDASLRVAIVINGNTYVYAPVISVSTGTGTITPTFSYNVNGATTNYSVTALEPTKTTTGGTGAGAYGAGKNVDTGITAISNDPDAAILASIYVYFEGEDVNCKSSNIEDALDNLTLDIVFGTDVVA